VGVAETVLFVIETITDNYPGKERDKCATAQYQSPESQAHEAKGNRTASPYPVDPNLT
jgi:hypothetical protein